LDDFKNSNMINKYLKKTPLFLIFISYALLSQNIQEQQLIIKGYDLTKLQSIEEKSSKDFYQQKDRAILLAKKEGWKLKFTDAKGSYHELMGVTKEGNPIYYKTLNVDAAISTRTNFLHDNGGLGLNIEGQGMIAHIWDGGIARATHQEYVGDGEESRFSIGDGSSELNFHAAHVTGTVIAAGVDPLAKGMAPKATAVGYNWSNDESEATSAAANGMLISNHSYGFSVRDEDGEPSLPAYYFGGYINDSRDWDNIMYNAPYYLMVVAAGNEGNDNTANVAPLGGDMTFDKLTGHSTSKNNLVIANGNDAIINTDGTLVSVTVSSGSSEGPTDDLRVKPDLMGNGTGLYSTYDTSDSAYNSISGTSMASPNVAGSLLLLQQYYKETYGNFMRSATLKGLALHTADDVAILGPDAASGWGLMNTKKAAETVTKKDFQSIISEIEIVEGGTYTLVVKSDGIAPLLASISWTDLPGVANTGVVNDPTPVLVHDLDIKVTNSSGGTAATFLPWKLTSINTNEKGDNIVDPYERVDIENASGEYTITISHKGTLQGGAQRVSLIVTGVSSGIALLTSQSNQTTCANTAIFDFNYVETIGGTTVFSVTDLPVNATVNLSDSSMSSDGNFTATFGNLDNVVPGLYAINLTGTNGDETTTTPIQLRVIHQSFLGAKILPSYPTNGLSGVTASKMDLSWQKNSNAETYLVEVSESPSFTTILFTEESYDLKFTIYSVENETIYYWRVKPQNSCVSGDYSPIYSFQTGISDCSKTYSGTDFSSASMDTIAGVTAFVPMNILDNIIIDKIIVNTDISHTWPGDLTISLKAPESINTKVVLFTSPCSGDGVENIQNITIDDAGDELSCSDTAPAISGTVAPENYMSLPFYGEDAFGVWELVLFDGYNGDGGQINSASITFCDLKINTNVPSLELSDIIVEKNTSHTISAENMLATTAGEFSSAQIYTLVTLPEKGFLEYEGTILSVGDTFVQKKLQGGALKYINTQDAAFSDEFKVDVVNAAKGWLPDNTVSIREATLSLDRNIIEGVSFWPNPVKNVFNIKIIDVDPGKVFISLFDLRGRKIIQVSEAPSNNTFTKEINLKGIVSGVYLLNIQQGNKKTIKKIIVSN
jgi:subtilisin-like proprotein convertase family protein